MKKETSKKGLLVLGVVALLFVLYQIQAYLMPFLLAYLLAYIVDPIVDFIQEKLRVRNRVLAVWVFLIAFMGIAAGLVVLILPSLASEFMVVKGWLEKEGVLGKTEMWLLEEIQPLIRQLEGQAGFNDLVSMAQSSGLADGMMEFLKTLFSSLGGFVGGLFSVFTFLLYFFFILVSFDGWSARIPQLIPSNVRKQFLFFFQELEEQMHRYFRGQSQIVLVVAVLFSIGFKISGLPLAIFIGVLAGLLNYVPYLQLAIVIPLLWLSGIQAIETGASFGLIFGGHLLVVLIVQILQESVLNPRILGKSVGLHPAIILLSLTIWGGVMGMIGMLIAIPVSSLLIIYYRRMVLKNEEEGVEE